jgi:hypothetical protein
VIAAKTLVKLKTVNVVQTLRKQQLTAAKTVVLRKLLRKLIVVTVAKAHVLKLIAIVVMDQVLNAKKTVVVISN